jgi:hypothetical protein
MLFPHELHAEGLEVPCVRCHSPSQHKQRIITRDGCMECHHEEAPIGCARCHQEQDRLYRGMVAEPTGLEGDEDIMAMVGIECQDCHDLSASRPQFEVVEEACNACHEEGYDSLLRDWHSELQERGASLSLGLVGVREALDARADAPPGAREAYARAVAALDFVEKARPTHNPELSGSILDQVEQWIREAAGLLGLEVDTAPS